MSGRKKLVLTDAEIEARKELQRQRAREWYKNNKEKAAATRKAYYQKNRQYILMRSQAERNGVLDALHNDS